MQGRWKLGAAAAFAVALTALAGTQLAGAKTSTRAAAASASSCALASKDGAIKHVIYIQFDNTHFRRDNANVPSDLEQMPHLLNFIRGNGTLLTNDHTVLISHTANGILTNLTGMYSDRMGQAVSNPYRYLKADGKTPSSSPLKYWTAFTDDVGTPPAAPNYNMVNADS